LVKVFRKTQAQEWVLLTLVMLPLLWLVALNTGGRLDLWFYGYGLCFTLYCLYFLLRMANKPTA
jgi:hypothetical protein